MNPQRLRQMLDHAVRMVVAGVAIGLTQVQAAKPEGKPDILFFLVDDLGYQDVGFSGLKDFKTPAVDALAASGTILGAHYVQPVCSPTRATFLTGRQVHHTGVYSIFSQGSKTGLDLKERTVAEVLHDAGYTTACFGKWHLGEQSSYLPMARGFDRQYGTHRGMVDCFKKTNWFRDDKPVQEDGYSTTLIAKECCDLIRQQPADKPLFMYVPFNAVHQPLSAPDDVKARVANVKGSRHILAASMTAVDDAIAQVMKCMQEKGRKNTLVVFTSDNGGHGASSNLPLRAGKCSIYEGGIRTCTCVSWPGVIPAGKTIMEPVQVCDWLPTFAKAAGAKTDRCQPLDGRDLLGFLSGKEKAPARDGILVAAEGTGHVALRVGPWKLMKNPGNGQDKIRSAEEGGDIYELYDVVADISEKNDLASKQPERVATMKAQMEKMLQSAVPVSGKGGKGNKGGKEGKSEE